MTLLMTLEAITSPAAPCRGRKPKVLRQERLEMGARLRTLRGLPLVIFQGFQYHKDSGWAKSPLQISLDLGREICMYTGIY